MSELRGTGRDRGQCVGWASDRPEVEPTHPPHRAAPEEFGYSGSRCRECENARKRLSDFVRRAEMRAGARNPKPRTPPMPKRPQQPQTPTKVVPQLPFATYEERLVLATFGAATGGTIRRKLRERRIAEWFGGSR